MFYCTITFVLLNPLYALLHIHVLLYYYIRSIESTLRALACPCFTLLSSNYRITSNSNILPFRIPTIYQTTSQVRALWSCPCPDWSRYVTVGVCWSLWTELTPSVSCLWTCTTFRLTLTPVSPYCVCLFVCLFIRSQFNVTGSLIRARHDQHAEGKGSSFNGFFL